ncbi:Nucleolar protein 12 [Talaromyces atroroseus]|uniref:Nucleolar protein 12 n=1 Tax=Talaromyces atroroseus TaxID=1441469 RepID=A0A225AFE5_TALAT|nr:Nucleolar protein 12 [Talaromyces atroroseus]OKL56784.1 Nucleolar protein 12 [Talaromyces atroroseus]
MTMGKKWKTNSSASNGTEAVSGPALLTGDAPIDPLLASLFDKSAGPVKAPTIQYTEFVPKPRPAKPETTTTRPDSSAEDGVSESADSQEEDTEMQDVNQSDEDEQSSAETKQSAEAIPSRKRKRGNTDNLEDAYMQKLAREEQKEKARREAEKTDGAEEDNESNKSGESEDDAEDDDEENDNEPPPVHETVSGSAEAAELDKSNRTVFLGNVSNSAITSKSDRKTLLTHVSSFLSTLPKSDVPHKVESIRFRSTAYGTKLGVPRRAAFAHKEIMDTTASSTNAYIVYSTPIAAQRAPRALNGTVVLDRHLRVDNVAHPSAIDNKRCVFVGNLDFVGQETVPDDDEEGTRKKKKPSAPADVEEGLWRTFNSNTGNSEKKNAGGGNVESVRVIRDQATRIGKGFAYVQFYDSNCVEAALLLDGKKFPPLLPRKLRVTRARKASKKRETGQPRGAPTTDSARNTLRGRAKKLLGRAGAAKVHDGKPFVFEGQRAVEKTDTPKTKSKSRGGSKGRPNNRSSKRAALYRASGERAARKASTE